MTSHAMQGYLACSRHQFSLFRVSCIPSSVCFGKDKTKLVVCKNVLATNLSKNITGDNVFSHEKDGCT